MTETTASGAAQDGTGARKGLTISRINTRDGARRKDCPFYQESAERRARIKNRGGGWGIGQKHNRQRPPKNAYR